MHGATGTGKTLLAKSLAWELASVYYTTVGSFQGLVPGSSEKKLQALFKVAQCSRPSVIILEDAELELILGSRQKTSSNEDDLSNLRNELSIMMSAYPSVVVVALTTLPDFIDPSFL